MADQENKQYIIVHSAKYETTYNKKYLNRKVWEEPNFNLIKSYIPGTIIDVLVKEGQVLKSGASIIVSHERGVTQSQCSRLLPDQEH